MVGAITPVSEMPLWENGGYFVLRQEIFDHIPEGGDLVADGCGELAKRGRLLAYPLPRVLEADRHRQGAGRRWTTPTPAASGPGRCGSTTGAGEHRVIGLRYRRGSTGSSRSARTATTSRSARAARLLTICAAQSRPPGRRAGALRRRHRARGRGARRAGGVLPGRGPRRHRAQAARRPASRALGRGQERAGGAAPAHRPGPVLRAAHAPTRTRTTAALAKLVPTAFRDHLALGYEIVKWDGDLGRPIGLPAAVDERRRGEGRPAADSTTPRSGTGPGTTARPSSASPASAGSSARPRYAEAFHVNKLTLDLEGLNSDAGAADRAPGLPGHGDGPGTGRGRPRGDRPRLRAVRRLRARARSRPTRPATRSTCATSPPSTCPVWTR